MSRAAKSIETDSRVVAAQRGGQAGKWDGRTAKAGFPLEWQNVVVAAALVNIPTC